MLAFELDSFSQHRLVRKQATLGRRMPRFDPEQRLLPQTFGKSVRSADIRSAAVGEVQYRSGDIRTRAYVRSAGVGGTEEWSAVVAHVRRCGVRLWALAKCALVAWEVAARGVQGWALPPTAFPTSRVRPVDGNIFPFSARRGRVVLMGILENKCWRAAGGEKSRVGQCGCVESLMWGVQ